MQEHQADLGAFLTQDSKGQQVPAFLGQLADVLARERNEVHHKLEQLRNNIDHITDIVAVQQSYARAAGVSEVVPLSRLWKTPCA